MKELNFENLTYNDNDNGNDNEIVDIKKVLKNTTEVLRAQEEIKNWDSFRYYNLEKEPQ